MVIVVHLPTLEAWQHYDCLKFNQQKPQKIINNANISSYIPTLSKQR